MAQQIPAIPAKREAEYRKPWLSLERRRWLWAYTFLVLPLIFYLLVRIAPTIYSFWVSLHNWNPIALQQPWVGLRNYQRLLHDPVFWTAFKNTWIYVIVGVPVGLALSMVLALGLQRLTRFVGFYRTLYFVPYVTSLVAVSWVWRWMYQPNGLFNTAAGYVGLGPWKWINGTSMAIYCVIAMTVWQGLGFQIIIFLAGLESIPAVYFEAAELDGASSWQRFRDITIPLLNPTIVFLVVIGVISNLQVFTQIRNMTGPKGGPVNSTLSLVLYVYNKGFGTSISQMGYAAAMTVVLFAMILVITVVQLKVLSRGYEY